MTGVETFGLPMVSGLVVQVEPHRRASSLWSLTAKTLRPAQCPVDSSGRTQPSRGGNPLDQFVILDDMHWLDGRNVLTPR
jgi:hypothetical protein